MATSKKTTTNKVETANDKIRNVNKKLNVEKREVINTAILERKKLSNVISEIKNAAKRIEEKNKAFNIALEKKQTKVTKIFKPEVLQVSETLKMDKFSTALINANLTASQQVSILKSCGNYNIRFVNSAIYTIEAKRQIAKIEGNAKPFLNDYQHGQKFAALIPTYTKKHDELKAAKIRDAKKVKEIVTQFEEKQISEIQMNERLVKYMTKDKMALELNTLLGSLLCDLWKVTRPNLTNTNYEVFKAFFPDLDLLEKLVNQKSKKEIENLKKQIEQSQPDLTKTEI
jgi:hypothetical protein